MDNHHNITQNKTKYLNDIMNSWIKCEERMPEGDQVILAANRFGEIHNLLVKNYPSLVLVGISGTCGHPMMDLLIYKTTKIMVIVLMKKHTRIGYPY